MPRHSQAIHSGEVGTQGQWANRGGSASLTPAYMGMLAGYPRIPSPYYVLLNKKEGRNDPRDNLVLKKDAPRKDVRAGDF